MNMFADFLVLQQQPNIFLIQDGCSSIMLKDEKGPLHPKIETEHSVDLAKVCELEFVCCAPKKHSTISESTLVQSIEPPVGFTTFENL